jgi:predicted peroxiredoxin
VIDYVRKRAANRAHLNPLDLPLGEFIINFTTSRGGKILACLPCAHVRGYTKEDLLEGVIIVGSSAIHELIKEGAATLSF